MNPLSGVRVLTVEQFGAAPYGSMFLADLGAEVVKIENAAAGGDPARYVGPHLLGRSDSLYFQSWHTNKKSVLLDLKSAQGRKDFRRLARTADAVLNNLRGDQPAELGLDYASLRRVNRRIVCAHISAYGRDNERRSWPGYDFLMQAEAGLMSLTGEADGPPSRIGPSMIDYMTGMTAVAGLLSCVMRARQTGKGCDVDTCLFDVALHQLSYAGLWHLNAGDVPRRLRRSAHLSVVPVQTYPTQDGWIFIMCMTDKFWEALLGVLGRTDLQADPRFSSQAARRQHRDELTDILDGEFSKAATGHWLKALSGLLPVAPVYDIAQALANPFVRSQGMIRTVRHPERADLKIFANPLKIDGKRPSQAAGSALGADNAALLAEPPRRKSTASRRKSTPSRRRNR
jgi:crotonobetainyl-CoA:carnitine CoA-transferase CaiB-like acyl-CoA transferase